LIVVAPRKTKKDKTRKAQRVNESLFEVKMAVSIAWAYDGD
jgi:hypothetical protein